MLDINNLLNQFLNGQTSDQPSTQHENQSNNATWTDTAKNIAQQATQSGWSGYVGGAVAGGLISLLLTNSKARKIAGGALGYGGAAALGAMAMKAYQNYQAGNGSSSPTASVNSDSKQTASASITSNTAAPNAVFSVMLIKSMIMASKVDGHVDANEQERIFSALEKSTLSSDEKAIILDTLSKPINLQEITSNTYSPEQAGQIYLASRIAIDPDQPTEKEFLNKLAAGLKLPHDFILQLEKQITQS